MKIDKFGDHLSNTSITIESSLYIKLKTALRLGVLIRQVEIDAVKGYCHFPQNG